MYYAKAQIVTHWTRPTVGTRPTDWVFRTDMTEVTGCSVIPSYVTTAAFATNIAEPGEYPHMKRRHDGKRVYQMQICPFHPV